MNKLIAAGIGLLSAAAGFAGGFFIAARKKEEEKEAEIESVIRAFKGKELRKAAQEKSAKQTTETEKVNVVENKSDKFDYTSRAAMYKSKHEDKPEDIKTRPVYISESEVGQNQGYEMENLTYYPINDVLANEYNEPMDTSDIQNYVGLDFKRQFDRPNVDKVYVRNDIIEKYFCIEIESDMDYENIRG